MRYDSMLYRRCGASGLKLPAISFGLWQAFGHDSSFRTATEMVTEAFDLGITHLDLANNYGPPPGSAEEALGRILRRELSGHRHELIISTKAGYGMWAGPYGDWGSRKYLLESLDQSLRRTGLDRFDIFYHHRPDPETPLEETMGALDYAVRSGKALYVGVSNYPTELAARAIGILRELGTPLLIHQPRYNILDRKPEHTGLLDLLAQEKIGCIVFSPLSQGLLTDRYLDGIPDDSRAARPSGALSANRVTEESVAIARRLNEIARRRSQSLAQMAIAWTLRSERVTSSLIGASRPSQIRDNVAALQNLAFSEEELAEIDQITNPPAQS